MERRTLINIPHHIEPPVHLDMPARLNSKATLPIKPIHITPPPIKPAHVNPPHVNPPHVNPPNVNPPHVNLPHTVTSADKHSIIDIGNASENILKLRPVSYKHVKDISQSTQYGLIPSEVNTLYPHLVIKDRLLRCKIKCLIL
jgi:hypothetical protein